tara:strand:- start:26450 stop:27235 length:786 start_codon:yes stop_codon:yes gene_type:complete
MKKNYTLIIVFVLAFTNIISAQVELINETFETGFTEGTEIAVTDNTWISFGTDFTFPAKNVALGGAEASDWYARLEKNGATGFAAIERGYELVSGETYEFKAWVFPDAAAQKNAYFLRVLDEAVIKGESAKPTEGSAWEELSVSYVAEESKFYKFRLTKNWGATGASFDNFSVICTTCTPLSVEDQNAFEFGMYPNPVGNILTIQTEETLGSIQVLNLMGQIVMNSQGNDSVDVSVLSPGVYVLKLTAINGGASVKKFIKK